MSIGPVENHRKREEGFIVYPVYSRRSRGLSVGINLFPGGKLCLFNCVYCEVFPFKSKMSFTLASMEKELLDALSHAREKKIDVKDICFSGNGESTQSPHLKEALNLVFAIRDMEVPGAEVVLISNGTGLLKWETYELLLEAARRDSGLKVWLKLDAGTLAWYKTINRSEINYDSLLERIKAFSKEAPVILQTMLCMVNNEEPPVEEAAAWENTVREIALSAAKLVCIQIYGKARPAPEDPLSMSLPEEYLKARAASLEKVLASAGKEIKVDIFP